MSRAVTGARSRGGKKQAAPFPAHGVSQAKDIPEHERLYRDWRRAILAAAEREDWVEVARLQGGQILPPPIDGPISLSGYLHRTLDDAFARASGSESEKRRLRKSIETICTLATGFLASRVGSIRRAAKCNDWARVDALTSTLLVDFCLVAIGTLLPDVDRGAKLRMGKVKGAKASSTKFVEELVRDRPHATSTELWDALKDKGFRVYQDESVTKDWHSRRDRDGIYFARGSWRSVVSRARRSLGVRPPKRSK